LRVGMVPAFCVMLDNEVYFPGCPEVALNRILEVFSVPYDCVLIRQVGVHNPRVHSGWIPLSRMCLAVQRNALLRSARMRSGKIWLNG
jgi:hypothetical protein